MKNHRTVKEKAVPQRKDEDISLHQPKVLAQRIYQEAFEYFESFEENNVGSDLAYLMGAILTNDKFEARSGRNFTKFLEAEYGDYHLIWNYVKLVPKDGLLVADDGVVDPREMEDICPNDPLPYVYKQSEQSNAYEYELPNDCKPF